LTTEKVKSRWLTHFELTYAPEVIIKTKRNFVKDSTLADAYTITKQYKNNSRPWENISATFNFAYPLALNRGILQLITQQDLA